MTEIVNTAEELNLSTSRPVIQASALSMKYGDNLVLHELDFVIAAGSNVAVLGPNGAGKSTMIEILEGFRRPSAGSVEVLGGVPSEASEEWKSRVGVVLQAWRDHGSWRVIDFLRYVTAAHRSVGRTDLWEVTELLALVGLQEHSTKRIRSLSGGQRRRVDVAASLIARPQLLFLDEPTTGFDPEAKRSFHELMRGLAGLTTILWATHDLTEAEDMCDRILILHRGKIVADGTPEELRSKMASDTTVSWRDQDGRHKARVEDPRPLLTRLMGDSTYVDEIEVHKGSLEEAYMVIVGDAKQNGPEKMPVFRTEKAR
ncbi:ABC transporter ATP-binding protein [Agreia sp. COWG]|uniref:ABC transporter ATP-binding protein n=1 Tax=Agreia sp. COWG TaxID=2773266 RepID=UPI001928E299|nr:ABC transporter ATP-binding protein [Agreia sp. COWG]CAD5990959.1 ABC transporter domain-containing protein [Agreia sp. COWG]